MSQYVRDRWGTESGFPKGAVYDIAQTSDGYLWFGTEKGLVRFDGVSFQLIRDPNIQLANGHVLGLMGDPDGGLWVRLRRPTLLRYKDGVPGMTTRNHYTEADWVKNNTWMMDDVTDKLDATTVTKYTEKIDRASFFKNFGIGQDIKAETLEDDYIPEHLLTKEFLTEVKGILTPDGVLAANTFSSSNLYPYESATYASVYGDFYNLVMANRIIWAQPGKLADRDTMRKNAELLAPEFERRGFTVDWLMGVPSTTRDWPANTRVLTVSVS